MFVREGRRTTRVTYVLSRHNDKALEPCTVTHKACTKHATHHSHTPLVLSNASKRQLIYKAQIPVPSVAPPPALQTSHHICSSHPTQLEVHMQTDGPGKPQPLLHLLTEVLNTSRPSSGATPHTLPTNC